MSPEYAMHDQFSAKSDAWKLWRDNRPLELMDPVMQNSYARNKVIRCIQLGLLCVQEDVDDRPNMASLLLTLNSYSATVAVPRQPAFFSVVEHRTCPKSKIQTNPRQPRQPSL
ncbi:Cysteine-rich receptor-like protein kinase 10 [Forsythia ovata]|uniref:Cysteine-rich receptor-like protein kinase 10 n=1 Tax=Forsythia ovata TaxID=205694 RepID=A0ABD1VNR3_9LAMI